MTTEITKITESNQEDIFEFLRGELAAIRATLDQMHADWLTFKPIAAAYQRGGILAARTAAKRGTNGH
jgi:hypothetical protein